MGNDGPAKTMAGNLKWNPVGKEEKQKPGPGTYAGDVKFRTMRTEAAWSMGKGTRHDLAFEKKKSFQTSPGQYDPFYQTTKEKLPLWKFGSETRPALTPKHVLRNPPPTAYNVPSKISEGPKMAIHGRLDGIDMNKKNNFPGAGTYDM